MVETLSEASVWDMLGMLVDFAYDREIGHVQKRIFAQTGLSSAEMPEEAAQNFITFELTKPLAKINGIGDLTRVDIWEAHREPHSTRVRTVLSGIINYCRFKETTSQKMNAIREELQERDNQRLQIAESLDQLDKDVQVATKHHEAAMPEMRQLEAAEREARSKLEQWQEKEVQDLKRQYQETKAAVEGKIESKRALAARVKELARIEDGLSSLFADLEEYQAEKERAATRRVKTQKAREDRDALRRVLEAKTAEAEEWNERLLQLSREAAEEEQRDEEQLQDCFSAQELEMTKLQEMKSKLSDEEQKSHAILVRRQELDAELAREQRKHEAEMTELRAAHQKLQEQVIEYIQEPRQGCGGYDGFGRATRGACRRPGTAPPKHSEQPDPGQKAAAICVRKLRIRCRKFCIISRPIRFCSMLHSRCDWGCARSPWLYLSHQQR